MPIFVVSFFRCFVMTILFHPSTIRFTTSVEALKLIIQPPRRPVALKYNFPWAKDMFSKVMMFAERGSKSWPTGVQPERSRKHESTKTRSSQKGNLTQRFVWRLMESRTAPTCHRQRELPRLGDRTRLEVSKSDARTPKKSRRSFAR